MPRDPFYDEGPSLYELLKEKIQAANPEIMELKFGCRFQFFGDEYTLVLFNGTDGLGNPFLEAIKTEDLPRWNWASNLLKKIDNQASKAIKIHGRPITLADVLMTINKTKRNFSVDDYGTFFERRPDDETHDNHEEWQQIFDGVRYTWNLTKDLDGQNEETKMFLMNILL